MNGSGRILLVEDDLDTREALSDILTDEGYEVVAVPDGLAALAELARSTYSAVLLDLLLPGMSGWQLAKALKEDPARAEIPVISMSASATPAPGSVVYSLRKPLDLDGLLTALDLALKRGDGRAYAS